MKPLHSAGTIALEESCWKRTLRWNEKAVLSYTLRCPKIMETNRATRRLSRYYRHVADEWKHRWEAQLYPAACQAAQDTSRPFQPWEATLTYEVTYHQDGLLSLYLDAYEWTGGAHGITLRTGDTWELSSGTPRALASFFPRGCRWKAETLRQVRAQIQARMDSGESVFFPEWSTLAASHFHPERFYLTTDGPAVFYPLYTIAPYVEGIPVFSLALPAAD